MRRRHQGVTDETVESVRGDVTFGTEVKGESHYQEAILDCAERAGLERSGLMAAHASSPSGSSESRRIHTTVTRSLSGR